MNISIVGSGNVAWHFAQMWQQSGHVIAEIWSRNAAAGTALAHACGANFVLQADRLSPLVDFIFIAVKDDAIAEVAKKLPPDAVVVHSSGATPVEHIAQKKRGVIWGVRSFRKEKSIHYAEVPFCIEASDHEVENTLRAALPEGQLFVTTFSQRAHAHLALVFGNNFVTQLYAIAEEILHENGLPTSFLLPSAQDISEELAHRSPQQLQTGPARRGDRQTLMQHLTLLKDQPDLIALYTLMSNRILEKYQHLKL